MASDRQPLAETSTNIAPTAAPTDPKASKVSKVSKVPKVRDSLPSKELKPSA
jgi:hypothetical protein